ncbi:MAG: PHP domain-containing protein, partial [Bacteroidetes bacterium]
INEGLLHGIEVINDLTYSAEALQIALDHNLTIMATSDIHGLVDWQYDIALGGHRPLTLVFATEKTPEAIKDALLNRRTVGFFHNLLVGRDAYLQPLLKACFQITRAQYLDETSVLEVEIKNNSSADMSLQNLMPYSLHAHSDLIEVPHHGSTTLQIKTRDKLDALQLHFRVLNAVTAPKTHPELKLPVKVGG